MERLIVIFQSTHDVIKAERLCLKHGIACQAIPVPRELSAQCGIALEIPAHDGQRVENLLSDASLPAEFRSPAKP